jgi:5-methylcytosine-specific restriction endonuclease McrA
MEECPECGRSDFQSKRAMRIHRSQAHTDSSEKFGCPFCDRTFDSEHGLKIHASKTHDGGLAGETVTCSTCGERITRQPHEAKEYDNHFCSDDCEREWRSERYSGEMNPMSSGRVEKECEYCGEDFEVAPYREDTARFCSEDCRAEYQSEHRAGEDSFAWEGGMASVTCEECGEEFETYPAEADSTQFCSYDCLGAAREKSMLGEQNPSWDGGRATLSCEMCGSEYQATPARAEVSRFCSRECLGRSRTGKRNPNWKGGHDPYYGPNWRERRREVLERDNYTCQDCGMSDSKCQEQYGKALSVHHRVPLRKFVPEDGKPDFEAANSMDNLITLCLRCHRKWESLPVQSNPH